MSPAAPDAKNSTRRRDAGMPAGLTDPSGPVKGRSGCAPACGEQNGGHSHGRQAGDPQQPHREGRAGGHRHGRTGALRSRERSFQQNRVAEDPERAGKLLAALETFRKRWVEDAVVGEPSAELRERLRALGYDGKDDEGFFDKGFFR